MGWGYGYVNGRDVGYGVPAKCDHPKCDKDIDRGLSWLCGAIGGADGWGCGLFFCEEHIAGYRTPRYADEMFRMCARCWQYRWRFDMKPDVREWVEHKLKDESWKEWREDNPEEVEKMVLAYPDILG